ncbi:hypothetical protein GRJ2_003374600 [Grus japonensis]|uniref:Endonuclease/exonuclease/phosphatase domain-containing protein n=1 Tax=Grus japonensis TaxID=30415 RepID=A0ABC9YHK3_GRUJA
MEDPTLEQVEAPEGGCDPMGSPHWSKLLAGPVDPWREDPTPEQKRQGNLWQQAGQLGEAGFKLKDSGGGVQSGNAHAIASNWRISQANQSSDKCPLAASQDENQKANHLKGVCGYGGPSCTPPGKPASSNTPLKCQYTNARSRGNKQEELEVCVRSQGQDLIAITEAWWDSSQDWNAVMDGYVLFRKDRPARRGGGVALYVREQLECIELRVGVDEERVESLWVRMKGQANMGDTVVGDYYRPPDQEEEVDEAFYRQVEVASRSQALVLMGDLNHPDICWKGNTARHAQSRRFLQSTDDNFLTQVVEEPTRRGVLLDLVLTNKEGLVGDVKVGGSLGCNDHEMVEFRILRGRSRTMSRITTLDFRRANFGLFKALLGKIPWVKTLEDREVQEGWSIFKHHFLRAQDRCILKNRKS